MWAMEPKTGSNGTQESLAHASHVSPLWAQPYSTPTADTCSGWPLLWQSKTANQSQRPNHPPGWLIIVTKHSFSQCSISRDEVILSRKIVPTEFLRKPATWILPLLSGCFCLCSSWEPKTMYIALSLCAYSIQGSIHCYSFIYSTNASLAHTLGPALG